jgi:hypothetical protein
VPWPEGTEGEVKINWLIIGAMTGPGAVKPKAAWVQKLVDLTRPLPVELDPFGYSGCPLFLKDNLKWPEKIQEWPA